MHADDLEPLMRQVMGAVEDDERLVHFDTVRALILRERARWRDASIAAHRVVALFKDADTKPAAIDEAIDVLEKALDDQNH